MNNPIMEMLNQGRSQQQMNNPIQMMQAFASFKKQMQGKNPQAIVNNLLQSGKMSQQQFEELKQQAIALQSILK